MNVLIMVVALLAGLVGGWLLARAQAEITARGQAAELARLEATLVAERASTQQREAVALRNQQQVREAFGALAGEALRQNNEAFVALAEARLTSARTAATGDLAQRQQAIEGLVAPLRESLESVQDQLHRVERERAGSYSALLEQIGTMRQSSEQLRVETAQLVTALRAPQVRGRWGELQLERAVEAAGMTEHIDYVTQISATTASGATVRPDLIVRLVGGKNVVVDSKVAFSGYLEAMEARDEPTRAARLKAHARHLRDHITSLGDKAYWEQFAPCPEFVVCFIPADAFLDAALREDPTLLEHAFGRNVVVATPSTLVTLLRTVAYTWRQDALAANAAEVHKLGRELYQRLSTMGGHIDKLGRSLNSAVGSYNQTVSSLEGRVLVTARKMADLKVVDPTESLPPPGQLTETARSAQAPELIEQRVISLAKQHVPIGQTELPTVAVQAPGA
jgi:DNA recombination protein RmuC